MPHTGLGFVKQVFSTKNLVYFFALEQLHFKGNFLYRAVFFLGLIGDFCSFQIADVRRQQSS